MLKKNKTKKQNQKKKTKPKKITAAAVKNLRVLEFLLTRK
jgi:hypothetical protein